MRIDLPKIGNLFFVFGLIHAEAFLPIFDLRLSIFFRITYTKLDRVVRRSFNEFCFDVPILQLGCLYAVSHLYLHLPGFTYPVSWQSLLMSHPLCIYQREKLPKDRMRKLMDPSIGHLVLHHFLLVRLCK